ncbi:MAG: GntR family transcriptional regulator [Lentisphaeria bacterium]
MTKRTGKSSYLMNKVKGALEEMIAQGVLRRGGLVPSCQELAKTLGASPATVQRAMQALAAEGKLVRHPRKGTVVAEGAAPEPARGNSWAVLVRDLQYFYPPIVETIEREASKRGVAITVGCMGNDLDAERRMISQRIAEGVSGIILAPATPVNTASSTRIPPGLPRPTGSLDYLAELPVPVVVIDHFGMDMPNLGIDCVIKDDFAGTYQSTVHMIQHGYRKIACFLGRLPEQEAEPYETTKRRRGFEAALHDYGLPLPELPALCSWDIDYNPEAIKPYLKAGYNAFVMGDDGSAALLVRLLDRWGVKVPDEVAVIGFDDDRICTMTEPPLSSVRVPKEEMGRKAVRFLHERIEKGLRDNYRSLVLKPEVVARVSCGCQRHLACRPPPPQAPNHERRTNTVPTVVPA